MSIVSQQTRRTYEDTPERQSLLSVVERERPDTQIELTDVAGLPVIGVRQGAEAMWIALDSRPHSESPDDLLRCLADMLLFCANCAEDTQSRCTSQRRHLAEKLRGFLGETGFQRFFRCAQLSAGRTEPKQSLRLGPIHEKAN